VPPLVVPPLTLSPAYMRRVFPSVPCYSFRPRKEPTPPTLFLPPSQARTSLPPLHAFPFFEPIVIDDLYLPNPSRHQGVSALFFPLSKCFSHVSLRSSCTFSSFREKPPPCLYYGCCPLPFCERSASPERYPPGLVFNMYGRNSGAHLVLDPMSSSFPLFFSFSCRAESP